MRTAALLLCALAACTSTVEVLPCLPLDGGPNACPAAGPPVRFTDDGPCTAALAAPALRYGLCTCSDLTLHGTLLTNAVTGPHAPPLSESAAVGVNGNLVLRERATIGGALVASGTGGISATHLEVSQTVRSGGPLHASDAELSEDAWLAGSVDGDVAIGGTLHVSEAAAVSATVRAGTVLRESIEVPPPCDCERVVDVAALADRRRGDNDDDLIGLSPNRLAHVEEDTEILLPSGQFVLAGIVSDPGTDLALRVEGNALLIVDGDLLLGGSLRVFLASGASLDVAVTGDVSLRGGTVGSPSEPERVRLWLGSTVLQTLDEVHLDAMVHAPDTVVSAGDHLDVTGAVLCRALAATGDVTVHFARNALAGPTACGGAEVPAVQ